MERCISLDNFWLKRTATAAENIDKETLVSLIARWLTLSTTGGGSGVGVAVRGVLFPANELNKDEKNPPEAWGGGLAILGAAGFFCDPDV